MKKLIYLTYLILCCIGTANAQDIVFDGSLFKNELLQNTSAISIYFAKDISGQNIVIDANGNGEITQAEAALVYQLKVQNGNLPNVIGLQYFVNLTSLNLKGNIFSTIDVSNLFHLTDLDVSSNNSLISIYAKNGSNETITLNGVNNSLAYICVDESQVVNINSSVSSSIIVNSFCTLPPGGDSNKITGQILFDADNDGAITPDMPYPNIKLKNTLNAHQYQTACNSNGDYSLFIDETGLCTVSPLIENPSWFNITPFSTNFTDVNNSNIINHNFLMTPIASHFDVEVIIVPKSFSLLLLASSYEIVLRNKGNQPHTGQVQVSYNPLNFIGVSSSTPLLNSGTGLLTYQYTNLMPFETKSFTLNFGLSLANLLPLLGQTVALNATIDPNGEDPSTQGDNHPTYQQRVVNNNSSNKIECLEGNSLPQSKIGDFLNYNISFQNNGNSVAKNVTVVTDFVSSEYDINSLQIIKTSHELDLYVKDNKVTASLRNANLGGPGGSGGILLKIRTLPTLPAGSTVSCHSEIFYEYDTNTQPQDITTNDAPTTFQSLSISINNFDNSIAIYPNPTSSIINIDSNVVINNVELYDVSGRLLQTNISNTDKTSLDISQRENGVYFLKITSEKGQKVEQIIKK